MLNRINPETSVVLPGRKIPYLFRDDFTYPKAAPLTSPRRAEPGPGTLTITDTGNKLTINNGALVAGTSTNTRDPWVRYATGFSRVAGRTLLVRCQRSSTGTNQVTPLVGWVNTLTTPDFGQASGFMFNAAGGGGVTAPEVAALLSTDSPADSTYFNLACVLRAIGFLLFTNMGSGWSLAWLNAVDNTATMYPTIFSRAGVGNKGWQADYFRVTDVSGALSTASGFATLNVASPVSGTLYSGDADAIFDLTVTSPNPLTGTQAELRYRVIDDNNYWVAYFNAAGAFRVDSVVAGTPTNRVNVAGVIGVSTTLTIRVIASGTRHIFYTFAGTTPTQRGAELNVSTAMDSATGIKPVLTGAYTMANLLDYPRQSALYNVLNAI